MLLTLVHKFTHIRLSVSFFFSQEKDSLCSPSLHLYTRVAEVAQLSFSLGSSVLSLWPSMKRPRGLSYRRETITWNRPFCLGQGSKTQQGWCQSAGASQAVRVAGTSDFSSVMTESRMTSTRCTVRYPRLLAPSGLPKRRLVQLLYFLTLENDALYRAI